jgi:hypothetical protein
MTFQVSPPWIWVTLTTAPASGSTLRLAIVCRPPTICAADRDLENVEGGHHRTGPDRELPGRQPWPVVHAVERLDRVAVEHPLFDHQPRAALVFLGRLEDEMHRAGEVAGLGEVAGGAEQHRGMAVMAAGVHPPGMR